MVERLAQAMRCKAADGDKEYYRERQGSKSRFWKLPQGAHHLAVKRWQDFFVEKADHLYHWVDDRTVRVRTTVPRENCVRP